MTGYQSKRAAAQDKLAQPEQAEVLAQAVPDETLTIVYQVGLTDEEIADYLGDEYHDMSESELRFFRLGEAATKEKNT